MKVDKWGHAKRTTNYQFVKELSYWIFCNRFNVSSTRCRRSRTKIFVEDYWNLFALLVETNEQIDCIKKKGEWKQENWVAWFTRLGGCTLIGRHIMARFWVCSAVDPSQVHVHRPGIPALIHMWSLEDISAERNVFSRVIGSRKSVNEQAAGEKLWWRKFPSTQKKLETDKGPLWHPNWKGDFDLDKFLKLAAWFF